MAVTLRDIAKALNLSHATVSFVLNDRRDVAIPERTRQRVMETAQAMGYQPNRAARALVMGRTMMVAVWQPSLASGRQAILFDLLQRALRQRGYGTIYCEADPEVGANPYDTAADGVLAVEVPLTDRFYTHARSRPTVSVDSADDVDAAVERLIHKIEHPEAAPTAPPEGESAFGPAA